MSGAEEVGAPEKLEPHHDLSLFDSGSPVLDDWLRRRARPNQSSGASRTYVIRAGQRVIGYYALAAGAVAQAEAPGRTRRTMPDPVPVGPDPVEPEPAEPSVSPDTASVDAASAVQPSVDPSMGSPVAATIDATLPNPGMVSSDLVFEIPALLVEAMLDAGEARTWFTGLSYGYQITVVNLMLVSTTYYYTRSASMAALAGFFSPAVRQMIIDEDEE
jgi:hypothetical protein